MYKVNDKIRARVLLVGKTYDVDNTPEVFEWLITKVDIAGNILEIKHADGTEFSLYKSKYMLDAVELIPEPVKITEPVRCKAGDTIKARINGGDKQQFRIITMSGDVIERVCSSEGLMWVGERRTYKISDIEIVPDAKYPDYKEGCIIYGFIPSQGTIPNLYKVLGIIGDMVSLRVLKGTHPAFAENKNRIFVLESRTPLSHASTSDLGVFLEFAIQAGDLDKAQLITNEIAIRYNKLWL